MKVNVKTRPYEIERTFYKFQYSLCKNSQYNGDRMNLPEHSKDWTQIGKKIEVVILANNVIIYSPNNEQLITLQLSITIYINRMLKNFIVTQSII